LSRAQFNEMGGEIRSQQLPDKMKMKRVDAERWPSG
jgi:hypothetical protein